ncbi:MAG: pyridoxal phosphate-dependent aminotransferase [Sporomusaceae bacterium]|jgi:cystathionine beta-lyase|nr:pyridoxal phosphate-dependent aminotransferase [Sporomusaceae bacterium]
MRYNFDEIIERKNTDSLKYDFHVQRGKPDGLLPLWVADMDFRTPPPIIAALAAKSQHGIFGYSESRQDYFQVLQNWFYSHFNWETEEDWLIKTPGVVYALYALVRALTNKGDAILIQQPVYPPFSQVVFNNERSLIVNRLIYSNSKYSIDFADFEAKIVQNKVKLFILCSPHNPVGRVWTKEELVDLGNICLKHGVTVISDEIHADFVYPGYRHTIFANINPEFAEIAVTCTAPTKTFNLAGLQISNIFVKNKAMRDKLKQELVKNGYNQLNIMGLTACKAAYENGREWLMELNAYLAGNLDFARSFLRQKIPQVQLVEPEGTYLLWLDFKELGLSNDKLEDLIVDKARLWLNSGLTFGEGGAGFQRVNIACPRSVLKEAFVRLEQAVSKL